MIRINLLPHRAIRRERRKKDFLAQLVLSLLVGCVLAVLVALGIDRQIDQQLARNAFIEAENRRLDDRIKEISLLRQEIDSLKAHQQAVESLQRDRALPVHLIDELVRHTPDGLHFRQLKQEGRKVTLVGLSESNERVSALLGGLAREMPSLERPELVEIKAVTLGKPDKGKEPRRVFEFTVNALVRAQGDGDAQAQAEGKPGAVAIAPAAAR